MRTRTHEKVVRLWTKAADFEQLHQIKELAMYVAAYLHVDEASARYQEQRQLGESGVRNTPPKP